MKDRLPSRHVRSATQHLPSEHVALPNGGFFDPSMGQSSEIDLREYWRVLYKYRFVTAGTVVLALIASLVYSFTAAPRYTASSKIRISSYEPVLSATRIEDMLQQKSKESNYLETQLEEIKSFSLADRVLQKPALRAAFERGGPETAALEERDTDVGTTEYRAPIGLIRSYLGSITVRPIRRTSLVTIDATAETPQLSALIANEHASQYIDWVRQNRVDQQARGLTFLRTQADELRQKVADLERELADYAEANSLVAVNSEENITAQKMSQLNKLLTDATARRIEAEHAWQESERALQGNSAGIDDQSTQTMRSELAKLEAEHSQLAAKFTSSYPRVQQLESQIAGLRRTIEGQRRQLVNGLRAKHLASIEEERTLREELEQQQSRAFDVSKRQVQYNVLNRELTSSRDLLQNVVKQIKETALAVESNATNVSLVDPAVVPAGPSYPRRKLILALGLLIGALAGVALSFLLDYLDDTIRTPEELTRVSQLPALGVVPSFAVDLALGGASPDSVPGADNSLPSVVGGAGTPIMYVKNPKSLASEAYRTIRTGILLSQAGQPPRTILVSSAQSSEGKTTSIINLAASLASAGGQVVLIDADLRRPSVHRHFKLQRELPGLVEVITGQKTLAEVAIKDVLKRITLIPSGRIPPNPAELLGSMEMATLIDDLASRFDYVLIDSPPVLPVTDSIVLSRYVDGVVLVVKGGATPKKLVKDAKQRLQSVGARFLGTVLNDVDITSGDYYYYNRYYYSYYAENEVRADAG